MFIWPQTAFVILVYLNSKKVSIMWLLQRVHSETKVSYDFVYNKLQRVHRYQVCVFRAD